MGFHQPPTRQTRHLLTLLPRLAFPNALHSSSLWDLLEKLWLELRFGKLNNLRGVPSWHSAARQGLVSAAAALEAKLLEQSSDLHQTASFQRARLCMKVQPAVSGSPEQGRLSENSAKSKLSAGQIFRVKLQLLASD